MVSLALASATSSPKAPLIAVDASVLRSELVPLFAVRLGQLESAQAIRLERMIGTGSRRNVGWVNTSLRARWAMIRVRLRDWTDEFHIRPSVRADHRPVGPLEQAVAATVGGGQPKPTVIGTGPFFYLAPESFGFRGALSPSFAVPKVWYDLVSHLSRFLARIGQGSAWAFPAPADSVILPHMRD